MRKLAVLGAIVFALTVGATSAVAASPSPSPSPRPVVTPQANHVWVVGPAKSGALSASSRLTVSSSYSRGTVWVRATGVKKGDLLVVRIIDHGKSGDKTIASTTRKVLNSTGPTTFTFSLRATSRAELKALVKAGDALDFRLIDGTMSVTGTFHKG